MDTKFDYFIDQTNKRLEAMDKKLDQLITFRLMLIGGSAVISLVTAAIFELIINKQ